MRLKKSFGNKCPADDEIVHVDRLADIRGAILLQMPTSVIYQVFHYMEKRLSGNSVTILKLNFRKIWQLWRDKCCKSEHEGEEKALHARSRGMNVFMKEKEEEEYDIMQQVLDFVEEHNEDAPKQKRGKILKKDYGCLFKMMLELHLSLLDIQMQHLFPHQLFYHAKNGTLRLAATQGLIHKSCTIC